VTTVFFGIDQSRGEGMPILFETQILGGQHDRYKKQYSTLKEAEDGHRQACEMAFNDMLHSSTEYVQSQGSTYSETRRRTA